MMQYFRFADQGEAPRGARVKNADGGKGEARRMKKLLLGLGFGVSLMLLSGPPKETAEEKPLPAMVCGLLPAGAEEAPRDERAAERQTPGESRPLPEGRAPAPECPSADANGVPLLFASYRRANYRAFHYSDRAG